MATDCGPWLPCKTRDQYLSKKCFHGLNPSNPCKWLFYSPFPGSEDCRICQADDLNVKHQPTPLEDFWNALTSAGKNAQQDLFIAAVLIIIILILAFAVVRRVTT